jgi:ABC-2 type transport system ATP-binding protein
LTSPEPPVVEARDIIRSYGERRGLDGFTLSVPAGSVFGLLGPNGSGKSTFVTMVAAMEPPPSGSLLVFGQPPSTSLRRRTGTVFQENAQDPMMTVEETLALSGKLFGLSRARIRERGSELLAAFGLETRAHDTTSMLSGGMRRRLEMARALLHDPDLLLLDEPTTGVDPDERKAFWRALLERERGTRTVLLATNDLTEADSVCDQVAFIRDGRVVTTGSPTDLKRGLKRESLHVTWPDATDEQISAVAAWPEAGAISRDGDILRITVDDASAFVPRLFAVAHGGIRAVSIETASLEDAYFLHVGQREPRPVAGVSS